MIVWISACKNDLDHPLLSHRGLFFVKVLTMDLGCFSWQMPLFVRNLLINLCVFVVVVLHEHSNMSCSHQCLQKGRKNLQKHCRESLTTDSAIKIYIYVHIYVCVYCGISRRKFLSWNGLTCCSTAFSDRDGFTRILDVIQDCIHKYIQSMEFLHEKLTIFAERRKNHPGIFFCTKSLAQRYV